MASAETSTARVIPPLLLSALLYSLTTVFSKFAGRYPLFSLPFLLLYGSSLLVFLIYAVLWQHLLQRTPLSTAYAVNKALAFLFGMLWGALLFQEAISWSMILGAALIIGGILLVVQDDA